MSLKDNFRKVVINLLEKFLAVPEYFDRSLGSPKNILVVCQHNQFGDLLASVSLFRAIKETYPDSHTTLIASPKNYYAVDKNKYIDEIFIFKNNKLLLLNYTYRLKKLLRRDWDLAIVPATVSLTSCILTGLTKAKIKIGPKELNGDKNNSAFVFNHRLKLDWRKCPDAHISDFILDIVRPFGIRTKNYSSQISVGSDDIKFAQDFIQKIGKQPDEILVGLHIGAGKPQNRYPLVKYVELINELKQNYKMKYYFTCGRADTDELNFMKQQLGNVNNFWNKTIPQLAAMISLSDLFITNDTGVMHVAGTTATPQISIFGPTNPFNWAPVGPTKYFLRKSELISDVTVDDVFDLSNYLIEKQKNEKA